MPRITDIPTTWTAIGVPTATAETWQCVEGRVAITIEAAPGTDDGIILWDGRGWDVPAGATVRYRRAGSGAAVIQREKRA